MGDVEGREELIQVARWDYDGEGIDEAMLPGDPWTAITGWIEAARERSLTEPDVPEPDAISVATADAQGQPHVRTVLMRYLTPHGPGFYTNLQSLKGRDLAANPRISAALTWPPMFRAIRFTGTAQELPRDVVTEYFQSRPWGSRIGAWASAQSEPVERRAVLEERTEHFAHRWPDRGQPGDVPLPDFWGGYLIRCQEIELWAGRHSRQHDRLVYVRTAPGTLADHAAWRIERRQP